MSKILVCSPPVPLRTNMPMVNAGLGAISGWLKQESYDFDQRSLMVDCQYKNRNRWRKDHIDFSVFSRERVVDFLRGGQDEEIRENSRKMAEMVDIDSYDVILISAESDYALKNIMPMIKEWCEEKLVVIGGPCTMTNDLEIARAPYVDYGVIGDGEIPLSNILEHELEGKSLESDTGLVYMEEGELIRGDPYEHPLDMKAKPHFDTKMMRKQREMSNPKNVIIPYMLGRGCIKDCSFCNYFDNRNFNYKSIDKVVSEIEELKEEIGSKNFYFADSNILNDPDYVKDLAEEIKRREIDVHWGGQCTIMPRDQEYFSTLAEGGCKTLMHGIESVSDSVLHRMRKGQNKEMVAQTLKREYDACINPVGFFMTNYIGETQSEFWETMNFVAKNRHMVGASVSWFTIYEDDDMPAYAEDEDFGIEAIAPEYEDYVDRTLQKPGSYIPEGEEASEELKRLRYRYARRRASLYTYIRNFGRKSPLVLMKSLLAKSMYREANDFAYLYD